jgi:hypothetical protein
MCYATPLILGHHSKWYAGKILTSCIQQKRTLLTAGFLYATILVGHITIGNQTHHLMRCMLKASFILLAIFSTLTFATRMIGGQMPANPSLRGFTEGCEDQPQPCWFGIVPEAMTVDQARRKLRQYGLDGDLRTHEEQLTDGSPLGTLSGSVEANSCRFVLHYDPTETNPIIDTVYLTNCTSIDIGQAINTFGAPQGVETTFGRTFFPNRMSFPAARIDFYDSLTPFGRVKRIVISAPPDDSTSQYFRWRGFVPAWRYCQLEPISDGC